MARSFRTENQAIRPFRVRFCDCEVSNSFVGNASTSMFRVWYSVKTLVVAREAGRFPPDEQLTDRELRLLHHELANVVT